MKGRLWKIPLLVLGILAIGAYGTCQVKRRLAMVPLKNVELEDHAVGSFLIGLPKGAKIEGWGMQGYKPGYNEILAIPGITPREFEAGLAKRIKELKDTPHALGGSMLIREVTPGVPNTKVLISWKNADDKDEYAATEAYSYKTGCLFKITQAAFAMDPSNADPARDASMHLERMIRELEKICRNIRQRKPNEIPTEPGICYENAFLANDPATDKDYMERIMVGFAWKQRPDIQIGLTIFSNRDMLDPPLLSRVEPATYGCLRAGERKVGPLVGQELLETATESDGRYGHVFIWECRGEPNRWDIPFMQLNMSTGNGDQSSSLSDGDALKLWDAIVNSIRVRPTSPKKTSTDGRTPAPPAQKLPLGTRRSSGTRCPQAGTWECAHNRNLGGARRFFKAGDEFPTALVKVRRSLLSRLKGEPPEEAKPTLWTLVGYPEGT